MEMKTQKQHGFSLVELMVAMLIGLFLMGSVVSVYISSSQSSRVNEGLRTVQENGRYAMAALRDGIQLAGYIDSYNPTIKTTMEFPFGTTSSSDSLVVAFEGTTDCTGNAVTAVDADSGKILVQNSYSLSQNNELQCRGNGGGGIETIVENVDAIRILYGLDDDGDRVADRYVSATEVNIIPGRWENNISSVRIALLMNSGNTNVNQKLQSKTYQLLDTTVSSNDRQLHKVFMTTILLRNMMG